MLTQISDKINNLTTDEDHKQELWVYALENNTIDNIDGKLQQLIKDKKHEEKILTYIEQIFTSTPKPAFYDLLKYFSEYEQTIMFMLALGMPKDEIAQIRHTSLIRINQTINNIKKNDAWDKVDLIES